MDAYYGPLKDMVKDAGPVRFLATYMRVREMRIKSSISYISRIKSSIPRIKSYISSISRQKNKLKRNKNKII